MAEERLLEKILADEKKDGLLVIENFEQTITRANKIDKYEVVEEAENIAKNNSSGVIGTIKTIPRAVGFINWIEVLLASITIFIIYGFKKITTAVPSTLVALIVVSGVSIGFGVDYISIQKIPDGFPKIQSIPKKHF